MEQTRTFSVDIEACRAYLRAKEAKQEAKRRAEIAHIQAVVRDAARRIFPRFPTVRRAYLFGSALYGLRRDSDVDIAVEGELSAEAYFSLWRELDRAIPERMVDLVELDRHPRLATHVYREGMLIYERENPATQGRNQSRS